MENGCLNDVVLEVLSEIKQIKNTIEQIEERIYQNEEFMKLIIHETNYFEQTLKRSRMK